jgi:hypothetical protein
MQCSCKHHNPDLIHFATSCEYCSGTNLKPESNNNDGNMNQQWSIRCATCRWWQMPLYGINCPIIQNIVKLSGTIAFINKLQGPVDEFVMFTKKPIKMCTICQFTLTSPGYDHCDKCHNAYQQLKQARSCSGCNWNWTTGSKLCDQCVEARRGKPVVIMCNKCGNNEANHGYPLCQSCYIANKQTCKQCDQPAIKGHSLCKPCCENTKKCRKCGKNNATKGHGWCLKCYNDSKIQQQQMCYKCSIRPAISNHQPCYHCI